jgi:glycosyltransferase involved in cell wall biosynthesis
MLAESLISIVLPTYNRANLLSKAIQSIISQTFSAWELIIWDDGSSDDTEMVVNGFRDERIKYFYEPNRGKPYALNQGIKHSMGDYIAFLDDDDQWLPGKLEKQINILSKVPKIDLLFGNFTNINKETQLSELGFTQSAIGLEKLKTKNLNENSSLILEGWLKGISTSNFIAFDSVVMKKEVIDQLGPFNEALKASEDFEYYWRFGLAGFQAAYIDEVLLTRVKFQGSLSGSSLASIENQLKMLNSCAELSRKHHRPDTVAYLRSMYRNAWQNKIIAHGNLRDKKSALGSFLKSLGYGFRLGSLKIMIKALFRKSD